MRTIERKIILVTGATDGLGRRIAEDLAGSGAKVLLHGRNPEKGESVLAEIQRRMGNIRPRYYNADFATLAEVRQLAEMIIAEQPGLDVLINNAGLGAGPRGGAERETSVDGFERRFAVNYLAPFLLTRSLLPLLRRTAEERCEARIVNIASAAQQFLDFDNLMLEQGYEGMRAYAQSKLALVMFTFDLAEELQGTGVSANSLHPASLMDTKMVREWFGRPMTTVEEGARAVERLAISADLEGVSGEYFDGQRQARANPQAYDSEERRRLREQSEQWVGGTGGEARLAE